MAQNNLLGSLMYIDVEIKNSKPFLLKNFELQSQSNFVRHSGYEIAITQTRCLDEPANTQQRLRCDVRYSTRNTPRSMFTYINLIWGSRILFAWSLNGAFYFPVKRDVSFYLFVIRDPRY